MYSKTHLLVVITIVLIGSALASGLRAADWPAYRHDLARSGVTAESLSAPLHRQWSYAAAHAPRPAWPEPGRELNRLDFDYAYEVTVAGGLVYFGSSADHKVYAIGLDGGNQRWSLFTEGPVRFAPAIEGERLFVASDDGWLYCLAAADGRLLWRFHGGPTDERMIGNEQMISRWPLRSGVAVDRGTVYLSAGMWPNEGVYFYALDAENGEVVWKNETSGIDYLNQPHPPSCAVTGVSPQGYVLGSEDQLFLPTGRNVPAAYDRHTGRTLYYRSRPATWGDRWGGCWNMLAGGLLFGWRCHVGPDINVQLGEYPPDKNDGIVAFDAKTSAVKRDFPGKLCAVASGGTLYMSGSGNVTAYDFESWSRGAKPDDCVKWETPHERAYSLIMAGETLVVGGAGTVTTIAADTGEVVWQDKVAGQARSLAVADGRLLVSTTEGRITCYGPEAVTDPPVIAPKPEASKSTDHDTGPAAAMARRILDQTDKTAGYCLVLGAGDGELLHHLAKTSELTICCLEPDRDKVASARESLDKAGLYGVRVVVHHGSLRGPVYPDYFADLVVCCDPATSTLEHWPAEEVYRVLRPCGGTLHVVADSSAGGPESVKRWLTQGKVPAEEIEVSANAVQVVRGQLPGAGNWTHQYASAAKTGSSTDRRARLPLKLLWFGEPGPARLIARHWKGPAPLCVDGRLFVVGQYSLMAVDAYNGRQLWRRDLPKVGRFPVTAVGSNVAADEDSVYVAAGDACLRLDAATGQTLQTYQPPIAQLSLQHDAEKSLVWSYLAVGDNGVLGSLGNEREGTHFFLLTKDGKPRWTYTAGSAVGNNVISMDDARVYLIERTSPQRIARAKKRGEKIPATWQLVALDAATGKVAWQTGEGIAGRTELWLAEGVLLATGGGGMTAYEASDGKLLYTRAVSMRRFPVIVGDTIYGEPAAYNLRTGEPVLRQDPFTGAKTPWSFARSYGCGSISGGQNLLLFRSGTLGIYDLAGDTGIHNFGGVRAGCHVNAIAAAGLVLMPPADASCTCSYCFQTTIALAPAHKQETWSIFYERLPNTSVSQAALNLGAPGDHRDPEGVMWLAAPRPETANRRLDIAVPFRFTLQEGGRPYRVNADRVQIAGTDRPWIYASGLKGRLRAELDLEILDRGITSWPADQAPAIDGRDAEPCWDGYKAVALARQNASVTLRHDDEHLYLAYKMPASADPSGKSPWKASAAGDDAPIWNDDSFELYLSSIPPGRDAPSKKYLHLGVSASGARYDATWKYVTPGLPLCDIPRLDVVIDGETQDWADKGLKVVSLPGPGGKLRSPKDFDPSFTIGWNDRGVVILANVNDNVIRPASDASLLRQGDSVEVCLTPERGSAESYRLVVAPGKEPGSTDVRSRLYDHRKTTAGEDLSADIAGKTTPDGYSLEILLPWKNLKITPDMGSEFGMQVFVNDDDGKGERYRFQALWHPAGDPARDPLAYQTFRLAAEPSGPIEFTPSRSSFRLSAPRVKTPATPGPGRVP